MPEPGMGSGGARGGAGMGGGGRAEVGEDDVREAARIVAAIASASKAAPGALERLAAGNKFVGRPIREVTVTNSSYTPPVQKVYDQFLHPQKTAKTLLGITPQEWKSHTQNPAAGNVTVNAPMTAPASTRFNYASNKGLDFYNKSNIGQHFASGNPFEGLLAIGQLGGSALLGGLHQGWQGIQNMNDPNSPGHQFGAFEWESYPNLVDFGGNMVGLGRGLLGMGPTRAGY